MILSSQFSNARWALRFGRYKEININKERADLGSSEAGGIQQATRRYASARSPHGTQVNLEDHVYSWACHLYLAQDWVFHYKKNSIPEVPSAGKSLFIEKASWHKEKS